MGILEIVLCLIGVYLIAFCFMMDTKNIQSAFVFKVIPFLSGVYMIMHACAATGFIRIG